MKQRALELLGYLSIFGTDDLIRELGNRSIRMSPKYERLKQMYAKNLKVSDGGKT